MNASIDWSRPGHGVRPAGVVAWCEQCRDSDGGDVTGIHPGQGSAVRRQAQLSVVTDSVAVEPRIGEDLM